jgi:N-acylneuraminate cytidylyltransferase
MLPGFDYVVILQPTSPLRRAHEIDECIARCIERKANACISVTESKHNPQWMVTMDEDDRIKPLVTAESMLVQRQNLPRVYVPNGAVYVAKVEWLLVRRMFITDETIGYPMSRDRSVDMDTELDLKIVDFLLRQEMKQDSHPHP